MSRLHFTLEREATGSKARAATFQTRHGPVQTPVFMPVGTQATVKSQTVETLKAAGASVLLANTYHLLLRPGPEVFQRFGGIHRFMQWDRPVLTDSGGFQIFSLPGERALNEEGARFRSYVDGDLHLLSPESSIAMQQVIGSDIMMALDQCIPSTAPHAEAAVAMELTHRWARRSLAARGDAPAALFGIVQGACHRDLREKSAAFLRQLPFDGLAIGGLAVGETQAQRYEFTGLVTDHLPKNLPRYLMGVGTPIDILEAVHRGVDMFDCIIPSQLAQRGVAFTARGRLQVRRSVHKLSEAPLEAGCPCPTCQTYSRAYLHHLVKADEVLGWHLLGMHNFSFYHRLMRELRESILADRFAALYEAKRHELGGSDDEEVVHPVKKRAPVRARQLGDYEVVTSPQGFANIRQRSSGEVMHAVSRPSDEAQALYVEQSRLAERLRAQPDDTDELVVWDVGLGAAANAMAALQCGEQTLDREGAAAVRPLRLVSFELDLDPLRLALRFASHFPSLHHGAPHALLESGRWAHASGRLHWQLHHGDFLGFLESSPAPDLIFYDPFSAKTDTGLWTPAVFARIFQHGRPKPAELYTYSAATAVRVALLTAGFFVAEGVGTGPKATTTVAYTRRPGAAAPAGRPRLLGAEWLARWRRSDSKFPPGLADSDKPAFAQRLEAHPQFGG
ncbi:MAG: tRNA guanosine(34) transglycosylase Tgt [Opitutales bacterium]|nr:tRNA guanosine(34) transglycosylase Tgt [Opitutales bacterium]